MKWYKPFFWPYVACGKIADDSQHFHIPDMRLVIYTNVKFDNFNGLGHDFKDLFFHNDMLPSGALNRKKLTRFTPIFITPMLF